MPKVRTSGGSVVEAHERLFVPRDEPTSIVDPLGAYFGSPAYIRLAAHDSVHGSLEPGSQMILTRNAQHAVEDMGQDVPYDTRAYLCVVTCDVNELPNIYKGIEKEYNQINEVVEDGLIARSDALMAVSILMAQAFPRVEHLDVLVRVARQQALLREGSEGINSFACLRNLTMLLCTGKGAAFGRTFLQSLFHKAREYSELCGDYWVCPINEEVGADQFIIAAKTAIERGDATKFDEFLRQTPAQLPLELEFGKSALSQTVAI